MTEIVNPKVFTIPPLKPCPFCARENMDVIKFDNEKYIVSCKCGCESPHDSTSIQAVQRVWNRRRYVQQDKVIEAIGWTHADDCVDLDNGKDPRQKEVPEMIERARKDLSLG